MRTLSLIAPILANSVAGNIISDSENFIKNGFANLDSKVQEHFNVKNQNHVYSPLAIRVMIATMMRGTKGKAMQEMANAFNFNLGENINKPKENEYMTWLAKTFKREEPDLQQTIIWASDKYYNLDHGYRDDMREKVGVYMKRFKTFVGKEPYMNKMISQGTDGAIEDFFTPGAMTSETKLMILNSLKFNGLWHKSLGMQDGDSMDFKNLNGDVISNVESFESENKQKQITYYQDPKTETEWFYLKFTPEKKTATWNGKDMNLYKSTMMVIAMPRFINETEFPSDDSDNPTKLFDSINLAEAKDFFKKSKAEISGKDSTFQQNPHQKFAVQVIIPKFKFATQLKDLNNYLQEMGIHELFDQNKDPFDRLFGNPKQYTLDEAVHQATIEVNEKGAKASAATVVQIESRSGRDFKRYMDHPFKFYITNKRMDTVYFTGIVHDPSKAK